MAGGAALAFFWFFFGFWILTMVFWVITIVEVVRIPDPQYRMAGTEKVTWILVVCLAGIIGALIWRFAKRNEVMMAASRMPATPPGWYPDPSGQMRWWDGYRWTHVSGPPPY